MEGGDLEVAGLATRVGGAGSHLNFGETRHRSEMRRGFSMSLVQSFLQLTQEPSTTNFETKHH